MSRVDEFFQAQPSGSRVDEFFGATQPPPDVDKGDEIQASLSEFQRRAATISTVRSPAVAQIEPESLRVAEPYTQDVELPETQEQAFRQWYGSVSAQLGLDPNPDSAQQKYFYRRYWQSEQAGGASMAVDPTDNQVHFPSEFKAWDHPNRYVQDENGNVFDSITGQPSDRILDDPKQTGMFSPDNPEEPASMGPPVAEFETLGTRREIGLPERGSLAQIEDFWGKMPDGAKVFTKEVATRTFVPAGKAGTQAIEAAGGLIDFLGFGLHDYGKSIARFARENRAVLEELDPTKPLKIQDTSTWRDPEAWSQAFINTFTSMSSAIAAGGGTIVGASIAGAVMEAGPLFDRLIREGMNRIEAAIRAMAFGTLVAAFEKFGLEKLFKATGGKARILSAISEGATEWLEEPYEVIAADLARKGVTITRFGENVIKAMEQGLDVILPAMLAGGPIALKTPSPTAGQLFLDKARSGAMDMPAMQQWMNANSPFSWKVKAYDPALRPPPDGAIKIPFKLAVSEGGEKGVIDAYAIRAEGTTKETRDVERAPTPFDVEIRAAEQAGDLEASLFYQEMMRLAVEPEIPEEVEPEIPVEPVETVEEPEVEPEPVEPVEPTLEPWQLGDDRPFQFDPDSTGRTGHFRLANNEGYDNIRTARADGENAATVRGMGLPFQHGVTYTIGTNKQTDNREVIGVSFDSRYFDEADAAYWWAVNAPDFGREAIVDPEIATAAIEEIEARQINRAQKKLGVSDPDLDAQALDNPLQDAVSEADNANVISEEGESELPLGYKDIGGGKLKAVNPIADFVRDRGGILQYKADPATGKRYFSEEMKNIPPAYRARRQKVVDPETKKKKDVLDNEGNPVYEGGLLLDQMHRALIDDGLMDPDSQAEDVLIALTAAETSISEQQYYENQYQAELEETKRRQAELEELNKTSDPVNIQDIELGAVFTKNGEQFKITEVSETTATITGESESYNISLDTDGEVLRVDKDSYRKLSDREQIEAGYVQQTREAMNKVREKIPGMDQLTPTERESLDVAFNTAIRENIQRRALEIAENAIAKPRVLSRPEMAALLMEQADRITEYNDLLKQADEHIKNNDFERLQESEAKIKVAQSSLNILEQGVRMAGGEAGRTLRFLQVAIAPVTYDRVTIERRMRVASRKELSQRQRDEINRLSKLVEQRENEITALQKQVQEGELVAARDNASAFVGASRRVKKRTTAKTRDLRKAQIRARLAQLRARANMGVDPEVAILLVELAKIHIEDGAANLNQVVANIRNEEPQYTEEEIVFSLAGRVRKETRAAEKDAKADISMLRKQAKEAAGVLDALAGKVPAKVEAPKTARSIIRKITRQWNEVLDAANLSDENKQNFAGRLNEATILLEEAYQANRPLPKADDPRLILAGEIVEDIRSQVLDINKAESIKEDLAMERIATKLRRGRAKPKSKETAEARAELEALQKERQKRLREQRKIDNLKQDTEAFLAGDLRPRVPKRGNPAPKLRQLLSSIQNAMMRIEDNAAVRTRIQPQIDKVRDLVDQMYRKGQPLPDENNPLLIEAVNTMRDIQSQLNIENRIVDLEDQLRTGNFKTSPVRRAKIKSEELEAAEARLASAKAEVEAAISAAEPFFKTASVFGFNMKIPTMKIITTARGAVKTIRLGVDLNTILNQAGPFNLTNPRRLKESLKLMTESIKSEEDARVLYARMMNDPIAKDAVQHGLWIGKFDHSDRTAREEIWQDNILQRVPVVGSVFDALERANVIPLDFVRLDVYGKYREANPTASEEDLRSFAQWINIMTGRGELGQAAMAGRAKGIAALNPMTIFYNTSLSPRYFASRLQAPWATASRFVSSPSQRKAIAREIGPQFALKMSVLGLLSALGHYVEWDPDDSDFLKFIWGNQRLDLFYGQLPFYRMTLATGINVGKSMFGKEPDMSPQDFVNGLGRLWYYRSDPLVSATLSASLGKTPIGEDVDFWEAYIRGVAPLAFEDIYDAYRVEGWAQATATSVPAILGVRVSTFENPLFDDRYKKLWKDAGIESVPKFNPSDFEDWMDEFPELKKEAQLAFGIMLADQLEFAYDILKDIKGDDLKTNIDAFASGVRKSLGPLYKYPWPEPGGIKVLEETVEQAIEKTKERLKELKAEEKSKPEIMI